MSSGSLLLNAQNVSRRHPDGRRWLLENVSLQVPPGTRTSVAGPSGSGKTLLLRALVMLDPLDDGQIHFQGRPVTREDVPKFRHAMIYLHQQSALLEENVEAALRRPFSLAVCSGRRFDSDRIVELLERLGRRGSFLAKRAGDLSGGEIQIVALLRALQLDPTVLLLDEPTAALDPQTTRAVEQLLGQWFAETSQPRATVWVTHDTEQAQRVGEKVIQMQGGRIVDGR